MHNSIKVEFMKLKHSKLIKIGMLIALLAPLSIILKDLFLKTGVQRLGLQSWTMSIQTIILFMIVPILSGFVITVICQKEYSDRTIINQLTAPIDRTKIILSKLVVWAVYHIILTIIVLIMTYLGALLLFFNEVNLNVLVNLGIMFLKSGILNFISIIPIMIIVVLQRKLFYPSLIACLLFTLIGVSAINMNGIAPFFIPWSAASVLSIFNVQGIPLIIGLAIIICSGIIGISLSIYFFANQDI